MEKQKKLIVTADDCGLVPEITDGILSAHRNGIVTSTALLMNAPGTTHAMEHLDRVSGLEVGIHLSLVEGYSLSGESDLLAGERYFSDADCLHADWRQFCRLFVAGRIKLTSIARELELQLERFQRWRPEIAFANTTQHLHLLPGIQGIVRRLCEKYRIRALRLPRKFAYEPGPYGSRLLSGGIMRTLALGFPIGDLRVADYFCGFYHSPSFDADALTRIVERLRPGTTELMTHPGFDAHQLRQALPTSYQHFNWRAQHDALCDTSVRDALSRCNITLAGFADCR